ILAKYFLEEANSEFNKKVNGFSSEALKFLLNYPWPGNVRELRNIIRRAVLLAESDSIELGNLSSNELKPHREAIDTTKIDKGVSFDEITQEFQKDLIKRALDTTGNNKIKTAEILKMNKKTLYRKIKSLNISYP
ncbi:MAG: helix-turn-helix domain-containing protein, partial [Candidatus Roizmanbacteria bacterium]|nr:helix-turn-helix domain-containing protein [Candidatus Roizmanbacteria bacterium]